MEYFEGVAVGGDQTIGDPVLMKRKPIFNLEVPVGLAEKVFAGEVSMAAGWLFGSIWTFCKDGSVVGADTVSQYLPGKSKRYAGERMNELIEHGYAKRYRVHENGKIKGWGYIFMDPDHPPAEDMEDRIDVVSNGNLVTYYVLQNRRSGPVVENRHLESHGLRFCGEDVEPDKVLMAIETWEKVCDNPQNPRSAPDVENRLLAALHNIYLSSSSINYLYLEGYISFHELEVLKQMKFGWTYHETELDKSRKKKLRKRRSVSFNGRVREEGGPEQGGAPDSRRPADAVTKHDPSSDGLSSPKASLPGSPASPYTRIQREASIGRSHELRNVTEQMYEQVFQRLCDGSMFGDRHVEDQRAVCRPHVDALFSPEPGVDPGEWGEYMYDLIDGDVRMFPCMRNYPSMLVKDKAAEWRRAAAEHFGARA